MKNVSSISYHCRALEEMLAHQDYVFHLDNDINNYLNNITASVNKILEEKKNICDEIVAVLKLMDEYNDLVVASRVKFRINKIELKNGTKFFQVKGAIGYKGKQKLWVNISLGNEKKVADEYGTTDVDELKSKLEVRMIWETFKKYRNLREG